MFDDLSPSEAETFVALYRDRPVLFIEEVIGQTLHDKQIEIVESYRDNSDTAVHSCHGAGKTNIVANIGLHFIATNPYSGVVSTAPTARQVSKLLWKEIRKSIKRVEERFGRRVAGHLLPKANEYHIANEWEMVGFSTNDATNFQGVHNPGGVLVIFDEAPGVPPEIWEAARGMLTGADDKFIAIGNPTEPSGPFYEKCKAGGRGVVHISAYDLPNVKTGRTIIPGTTTLRWVEDRKAEWGESSPMFQSRVLGLFPDDSDDSLVPLSWIEGAIEKWREYEDDGWPGARTILSVDVARYGEDSTIFVMAEEGIGVRWIEEQPKQDLNALIESVTKTIEAHEPWRVRIDGDGVGAGVVDVLRARFGDTIEEMRGGFRSELDPDHYFNNRAEWFWTLRARLDPTTGGATLALPPNEKLRGQLTGIRYTLSPKGLIKIETKDEMRKRGMKSPDESDAVAYAMALPSVPDFYFGGEF